MKNQVLSISLLIQINGKWKNSTQHISFNSLINYLFIFLKIEIKIFIQSKRCYRHEKALEMRTHTITFQFFHLHDNLWWTVTSRLFLNDRIKIHCQSWIRSSEASLTLENLISKARTTITELVIYPFLKVCFPATWNYLFI